MSKGMSDAKKAMALVRQKYIEKMPHLLDELNEHAVRLRKNNNKENLKELHKELHKLSGSAGTFGLNELSKAARELEYRLLACLEKENFDISFVEKLITSTFKLKDILEECIDDNANIVEKEEPIKDTVDLCLVSEASEAQAIICQELERNNYQFKNYESIQYLIDNNIFNSVSFGAMICDLDLLMASEMKEKFIQEVSNLQLHMIYFSRCSSFANRLLAVKCKGDAFLDFPFSVPKLANTLEIYFSNKNTIPFRVLIVEDEEVLSDHYKLVLASIGMEVKTISSPENILEEVESFCPELILMDIYLGDYWGPDIASVIRQNESWVGLPIVYLSAEVDLKKQIDAMRRGADDFLIKPITDERLISSVKIRAQRSRQLASLIHLDGLTGILRHDKVKEQLGIAILRAQRDRGDLAVGMIDIDNFKHVNDTYGHPVGDQVIKQVASTLKQNLRASDVIGRYGGEEFVMVMPGCNAEQAKKRMDCILQSFSQHPFQVGKESFSSTFSSGISELPKTENIEPEALIKQADMALYTAKSFGKNQVRIFEP